MAKPRLKRSQRIKLQRQRVEVLRTNSCSGKVDYQSYGQAAEHVADIFRKWPWLSHNGHVRNKLPSSFLMQPYRCGYGNHVHLGHPRPSYRQFELIEFQEKVIDVIAFRVWVEVREELDRLSREQLCQEAS